MVLVYFAWSVSHFASVPVSIMVASNALNLACNYQTERPVNFSLEGLMYLHEKVDCHKIFHFDCSETVELTKADLVNVCEKILDTVNSYN